MKATDIRQLLDEQIIAEGLLSWGASPLEKPLSMIHYQNWLAQNHHGEMQYLKDHAWAKENPSLHFQPMRTLISFSAPYYPHPATQQNQIQHSRVSLYAQGEDYHLWFIRMLQRIIKALSELYPEEQFLCFTDSSPILERDFAARSGVGWVGKNTCIIHPQHGSLFFLGEILTSLDFEGPNKPLHNFCGTCTRCIDACPTQALTQEKVLDARRCISYLTIESKSVPPVELRAQMGDWFFGCDICQTVCPWNEKKFKQHFNNLPVRQNHEQEEVAKELKWILTTSNRKLIEALKNSPLSRAGGRGLKRNALIVIGNLKLKELKEEVKAYIKDERLGELASWTLEQLD